jgi:outer membrane protein OmpA-like peptidoglycan-associated protein
MRSIYSIIILVFLQVQSVAQNLVANGDFEDENICTEYIKDCAPEAWIATSLYANYYFDQASMAYEGRHFVGIAAGNVRSKSVRNFVRTRLLCGLRKGSQYRLELYVNSQHDVLDSIGAYFTTMDFMFEKRRFFTLEPQLWSVNGLDSPRRSHRDWQKISWIYTADGTEVYLTIGNFKRIDYTGISRPDNHNEYYFFIDNVSLKPLDPKEKYCDGIAEMRKEVYNENARHDMLQKWAWHYTKNPPKPVQLPVTRLEVKRRIDTLIIPDIFFATASYELSPRSFNVLDSFANKLQGYQVDSMVVEGHTDSVGNQAYNEKLSVNRAGSVQTYLFEKVNGLKEKTVSRGFAFLRPVTSNKTPQGRQKNRRVEIFLYRKE